MRRRISGGRPEESDRVMEENITSVFVFLYLQPDEKSAVKSDVVGSRCHHNERLLR